MSLEQVKDEMLARGLVDERKNVVFANAKSLPGGGYGLCLLAVKGSLLTVCDTDFSQQVGEILCVIPLDQIAELKASDFVLRRYLQFRYQDFTYRFADFGDAKNFIAAVRDGCAAK